MLMRYAKEYGCGIILVGHVTKEGTLAGPRVLEHMVDVVLSFEGDPKHEYRLLRATKNRFGSVNELGVFEMTGSGMIPVKNPSETLLSQRTRNTSGSCVLCAMEGTRPILVDVQALCVKSYYTSPRRTVNGLDSSRVILLLAVMESASAYACMTRTYISTWPGAWIWMSRRQTWRYAAPWPRPYATGRYRPTGP